MRYQGKVINWKDDQGYGFVIPNGGGDKAFVHIKGFASNSRRPVEGDLITYEVEKDAKNRVTAKNIRYAGEAASTTMPWKGMSLKAAFSIGLLMFLGASVSMGKLPPAIIAIYIGASLVTYVAYKMDKSAAQGNRRRTPERTLHLFSLVGGWPGAMLAQRTFRHKSSKKEFQTTFWGTVVVNCFALGWLVTDRGSAFLASLAG
jgi:uncharacterized membrane protein YsdA (DUF1294 family)/cold shock CspA family protein